MAESDNNSLSELAQILWTNKVQISKILDLWLNKFLVCLVTNDNSLLFFDME